MSDIVSLFLYLLVYTVSALCLDKWGKTDVKAWGVIGFAPPIILAALRYPVGTDFWTYLAMFYRDTEKTFSEIFLNFYSEGCFHSVAKLSGTIGDERLYFGVCGALTLIPVVLTYKKEKHGIELGLFTFIFLLTTFTTSLNIMRQGIAIAFTFLASQYIFERKPIKFAIWIVVAMLFHLSAIIFVPAYFLYADDKLFNIKRGAILIAVIIAVVYASSLIESLSTIESVGKYAVYSEADDRAKNRSLILSIVLLIIYLARAKKMQKLDGTAYTYLILFIISVIIETTGSFTPFIKRSGMYFSIYNIALACQWIKTFDLSNRAFAKAFIIAFFVVKFTISVYVLGQANIIPYNTKDTYSGYVYE